MLLHNIDQDSLTLTDNTYIFSLFSITYFLLRSIFMFWFILFTLYKTFEAALSLDLSDSFNFVYSAR